MSATRQQLVDLLAVRLADRRRDAAPSAQHDRIEADGLLDVLLSDEGRSLLYALLDETQTEELLVEWERYVVGWLRERAVLVRMDAADAFLDTDTTSDGWSIRLPGPAMEDEK